LSARVSLAANFHFLREAHPAQPEAIPLCPPFKPQHSCRLRHSFHVEESFKPERDENPCGAPGLSARVSLAANFHFLREAHPAQPEAIPLCPPFKPQHSCRLRHSFHVEESFKPERDENPIGEPDQFLDVE